MKTINIVLNQPQINKIEGIRKLTGYTFSDIVRRAIDNYRIPLLYSELIINKEKRELTIEEQVEFKRTEWAEEAPQSTVTIDYGTKDVEVINKDGQITHYSFRAFLKT